MLDLMYITNNSEIALIAEKYGVSRIWVDLETLGKEERQKGMNTVKSHHSIEDVRQMSKILTKSELMVRINPWNRNSIAEINEVISAGAKRIMLPMWKTFSEVDMFLKTVNKRVSTTLLLETREAVECLDEVLEHCLIDEIHIGLNDLHLSYGLTFMFELLTNGIVEALCAKMQRKGIKYGFGGIACIGEGLLPAEKIVMEHKRLGSTRAILSRGFCPLENKSINEIKKEFFKKTEELYAFEKKLVNTSEIEFKRNILSIKECVNQIVEMKQGEKQCVV